jgi:DNA-binding transcriptional MerR regulator
MAGAPAAVDQKLPAIKPPRRSSASVTIGEAARRSEFSIRTLRFYERRGILAPTARSTGGYRLYSEVDLRRLDFIRRAKALGLSLSEIRELVVATQRNTCAMTRPLLLRVLDERIQGTAWQIEALTRLKHELERSRRALARRPPTDHRVGYCSCLSEDGRLSTIKLKQMAARRGSTDVTPRR